MPVHLLTSVIQDLRSATLQDAARLGDGKLLDQFIEHKDEAAFAALVQRHSAMVWGVCRRMLTHHHDAEDAFQAAFLVLARNAASVRRRELVASWLYGVAQRTALKARVLASKRRSREMQVMTMPEPQAAQQDSSADLDARIDQELAGLPEKYRSAIILCDLEGKTNKVAARQLKVPEGTLAGRLRTGRRLLAKRLARHGLVPSGGALVAALAPSASAGVPPALVGNTVKAANLVAKGEVPAAAIVSAKVIALMEGAQKTMLLTKLHFAMVAGLLTVTVGLAGLLVPATGSPGGPGDQPKDLEQLLKLAPAERMRVLAKVVDKDKDFVSATRGPLAAMIVERGSLEAPVTTEIVYRPPPQTKGTMPEAVIKWVIDEGSQVKKGDKLIEIDPSALVDMLQQQKDRVLKAQADQKRAATALERATSENRIDVKLAEIDVRLAELALRQYKGDDALKKETLAMQVERATLLLERVKLQGPAKLEKASDLLEAKKSAASAEHDRLREMEKSITNFLITAPRDGVVAYYVSSERAAQQAPIIAQGEPVREGQKLLRISDLKQMAVSTRVDESLVRSVRAGQAAKIRVDAFPGRTLAGKVSAVAKLADHAQFLHTGAKSYNVMVSIDGENKDLKPGMTAEVTITTGEEANALRLPATAVLGKGKEAFCYVLAGNELQVRKVILGLQDGKFAEIRSGLQEEDRILRDPSAAIGRLNDSLRPGKE
jgi:RND family efflux transporter MFP subunit